MMTLPPPSPPPIADTLKLIQAEAVRLCGDEDGVVEDPLSCYFRPQKIRCKSAGDAYPVGL